MNFLIKNKYFIYDTICRTKIWFCVENIGVSILILMSIFNAHETDSSTFPPYTNRNTQIESIKQKYYNFSKFYCVFNLLTTLYLLIEQSLVSYSNISPYFYLICDITLSIIIWSGGSIK